MNNQLYKYHIQVRRMFMLFYSLSVMSYIFAFMLRYTIKSNIQKVLYSVVDCSTNKLCSNNVIEKYYLTEYKNIDFMSMAVLTSILTVTLISDLRK